MIPPELIEKLPKTDLHVCLDGSIQAARCSATFCTDNRTVSNTTVSREIELAVRHLGLTAADVKRNLIYGFKRSFFPATYLEKRRYVRRIIDYYESLERASPELSGELQAD